MSDLMAQLEEKKTPQNAFLSIRQSAGCRNQTILVGYTGPNFKTEAKAFTAVRFLVVHKV